MNAQRTFSTLTRDAEFHLGHAARSLREAAERAPSTGLQRFADQQSRNLTELRRVLPAARARARSAA